MTLPPLAGIVNQQCGSCDIFSIRGREVCYASKVLSPQGALRGVAVEATPFSI